MAKRIARRQMFVCFVLAKLLYRMLPNRIFLRAAQRHVVCSRVQHFSVYYVCHAERHKPLFVPQVMLTSTRYHTPNIMFENKRICRPESYIDKRDMQCQEVRFIIQPR